ncbi:SPOSA6832_01609, partial [Sporobolomyces salmonicolor]
MPGNVEGGLLSIRLIEARGLPAASGHSTASPNDVTSGSQGAEAGEGGAVRSKSESAGALARRENAALPYVVLTFDVNEVLVDAIGGTCTSPSYMFLTTFDISRPAPLVLSAYLRTASDPTSGGTTHRRAQSISTNDLFLASVVAEVRQDFVPLRVTDRWYPYVTPFPSSSVFIVPSRPFLLPIDKPLRPLRASNGAGEFRIQVAFRPAKVRRRRALACAWPSRRFSPGYNPADTPSTSDVQPEPLTIDSFELLKVIGRGSFGKATRRWICDRCITEVDAEFLEEPALDSFVEDSQLSESAQALFEGFSYAAPVGPLGESVR